MQSCLCFPSYLCSSFHVSKHITNGSAYRRHLIKAGCSQGVAYPTLLRHKSLCSSDGQWAPQIQVWNSQPPSAHSPQTPVTRPHPLPQVSCEGEWSGCRVLAWREPPVLLICWCPGPAGSTSPRCLSSAGSPAHPRPAGQNLHFSPIPRHPVCTFDKLPYPTT